MKAEWISFFFFFLAALIHVGFFVFESILLQRPSAQSQLKLSESEFAKVKPWMFHQGFYNLFLAVGVFFGLALIFKKQVVAAGALTGFCGLCMTMAGLLLFIQQPNFRKWALLQFIPPVIGFFFLSFHVR